MRCALLQFLKDRVADALRVAAQAGISEAQCFDAARFQELLPLRVVPALVRKTVLTAVQFDVQLGLLTEEIEAVIAQRMLAAKLVAAETSVAQPAPHELFRPSFNLSELAGALDLEP